MIPKIIHYCWFGRGEKTRLAKKCIESWKKYCPDYEIIEWNEENFDVNCNTYTKMCYEQAKYAFLADYIRLVVVERYGGIYFDTDVEVLRSLDSLLNCPAFIGFENMQFINTGEGFGAEAHNPVIQQMLKEYDPLLEGFYEFVSCPKLNTEAVQKFGLKLNGEKQKLKDVVIFPSDYFNPRNSVTGKLNKTKNTYSIHWYSGSWLSPKERLKSKITRPIHRLFGTNFLNKLRLKK